MSALAGRDRELAELAARVDLTRSGRSSALVVFGEAGIGKSALLEHTAERARVPVRRMVASEYEAELPYAGLQLLCVPLMEAAGALPAPQREALEAAFGLRVAPVLNPFLVGLAVLGLLTEVAGDRGLLCIVDDAQWLDAVSAQALAFVARRLDAEGITILLAMRTVGAEFADLPRLAIEGLGDEDAREVLRRVFPGALDPRVRDQLVAEARGNPLALRELPRGLSPAEIGGGFALVGSLPLQARIERSLIAQLDPLPAPTRRLLLVAAADPTGDPELLWTACAALGLAPQDLDHAGDALSVASRVGFRHPLVRSAVYHAAPAEDRRRVHAALADAIPVERDPDRRAWHASCATLVADEAIAGDLERSAARARQRGGAAAAGAFLARAAELTPAPEQRAQRLIAAAEAMHEAGAPAAAVRALDSVRDQPLTALQRALIARVRARAAYALQRDRDAIRVLLAAAQGLDGLAPELARDTYIEALAASLHGGRLGDPELVAAVARAILESPIGQASEHPLDLLLRGQALLAAEGHEAAFPTLSRALGAFVATPPDAPAMLWLWFASRTAIDLWDSEALRALADRQVDLARAAGALTVLPIALSMAMIKRTFDGRLDLAEAACDEIDVVQAVTRSPLPQYGRLFLAAYRGRLEEVERRTKQIRADALQRGEGYALSIANFAEAIAYNGAGRYAEAVAAAREELPYTHELAYAARCLLELVEAASRTGERELAEQAVEQLASVTRPAGTNWARAILALAEALVSDGDEADRLYEEAIERFEREQVPMFAARSRLLFGETLRRRHRRHRGPGAAPCRAHGAHRLRHERLRRPRRPRALRHGRDDARALARGAR